MTETSYNTNTGKKRLITNLLILEREKNHRITQFSSKNKPYNHTLG